MDVASWINSLYNNYSNNLEEGNKVLRNHYDISQQRANQTLHPEQQYGPPIPDELPSDNEYVGQLGNAVAGSIFPTSSTTAATTVAPVKETMKNLKQQVQDKGRQLYMDSVNGNNKFQKIKQMFGQ